MTNTLAATTPRRGSIVRIPARMGTEYIGRVKRVVLIPNYYNPREVTRYYAVEGYGLLVADAELITP